MFSSDTFQLTKLHYAKLDDAKEVKEKDRYIERLLNRNRGLKAYNTKLKKYLLNK